jgi:hypothetical protein
LALRPLPAAVVLHRATPDIEAGMPATETGVGVLLGFVAFVLGMCWRI